VCRRFIPDPVSNESLALPSRDNISFCRIYFRYEILTHMIGIYMHVAICYRKFRSRTDRHLAGDKTEYNEQIDTLHYRDQPLIPE
jgi:hypothetical protein